MQHNNYELESLRYNEIPPEDDPELVTSTNLSQTANKLLQMTECMIHLLFRISSNIQHQ